MPFHIAKASVLARRFIYQTAPTAESLQFWTAELKSGISAADMMKSFLRMPGLSESADRVLIVQLYQNALGRLPTAAELTKINQQLQSGTLRTGSLIVSIAQSNETYAHLLKTL